MPTIKIHPPIIQAVVECLKAVFEEDKVADKEVHQLLKQNKQFGSRDRALVAESIYDIVRWKLRYQWQLAQCSTPLTYYKHLMLISLLQRDLEPVQPEVFDVLPEQITTLKEILKKPIPEQDIAQSYPAALYDFCHEHIGMKWAEVAEALNKKPSVFVRVNTLKTTKENLLKVLLEQGLEVRNVSPDIFPEALSATADNVLQIMSKNNLKNSELYKQGWFEFQDVGSQAIGTTFSQAIKNMPHNDNLQVLDLCAGAGGKTLHLSAILKNKGKIYATDYNASRLKNLQKRAEQGGCTNISLIDFKDAKQLNAIDVVLIDAPCSGTGTFKRQADLKYKVTPEKVQEYQAIQASLLKEHNKLLAKNGILLYATCSVLPQENEQQIQSFLKSHPTFMLEAAHQLLPYDYPGDGFYMAVLRKYK